MKLRASCLALVIEACVVEISGLSPLSFIFLVIPFPLYITERIMVNIIIHCGNYHRINSDHVPHRHANICTCENEVWFFSNAQIICILFSSSSCSELVQGFFDWKKRFNKARWRVVRPSNWIYCELYSSKTCFRRSTQMHWWTKSTPPSSSVDQRTRQGEMKFRGNREIYWCINEYHQIKLMKTSEAMSQEIGQEPFLG